MTEEEQAEAVLQGLAQPAWRWVVQVDQLGIAAPAYLLSCGHLRLWNDRDRRGHFQAITGKIETQLICWLCTKWEA